MCALPGLLWEGWKPQHGIMCCGEQYIPFVFKHTGKEGKYIAYM